MKKYISLALASLTVASALASCAPAQARLDDAIVLASSDAQECAAWLDERLDTFPTEVIVGIGSNETYGIDMSEFDEDGYILRSIGNDTLVFGASADGLDRAVRAYAKAADAGAASTLDETYHEGARIKKLTIAGRDISEYTVVYNHDHDSVQPKTYVRTIGNAMYAAEELVRLIEQATGVALPAVPHTEKVDGPVISIDYYTEGDLGTNGFTYEVKDGNLYINGVGQANGCANAVYYLLEHECGWESLIYGDSVLMEAELVDLPNGLAKRIKPMFRQIRWYNMNADPFDNDKSVYYDGDMAYSGHMIGTWAGDPGENICYTDEATYFDVLDNVTAHVDALISAGNHIDTTIPLGMEDNPTFCMCKDCAEVFRDENRSHSGGQARFANRLAADMEEAGYEGLKYSFLAYAGSNPPCASRLRDDVHVMYCVNGACQNHLLDGSQCYEEACGDMQGVMQKYYAWTDEDILNNQDFAEWMEGWCEVSDNIMLYYYHLPANFSQYNYTRLLYDDLQYAYKTGVAGYTPETHYLGLGLGRLCARLINDLIWHPEMTKAEYELRVLEMMRREYGDGYEYVKEYVDIWTLTEVNTGCWYAWFMTTIVNPDSCDIVMYAERADEMYALLEKALKLCCDTKQEERVKRLMCDVLYRECAYEYFPAYDAEDYETIADLEKKYDLFVEYLSECGYDFSKDAVHGVYTFGPCVSSGASRNPFYRKSLESNLTDAMWINLQQYRDVLTPEGTVQRPVPDGYEPYVPEEG